MVLAPDTVCSLRSAVWLSNSELEPDTLTTVGQLAAHYHDFAFTGRYDGNAAELAAVRSIRSDLRALLTSDRDTAATRSNELLAAAGALPQLVRHDDWPYHLHAWLPSHSLADRMAVEAAMALVAGERPDDVLLPISLRIGTTSGPPPA